MKIFIIGFMGSGKSTIGQKLAKLLNFKFVDMDIDIEHSIGLSINEIFEVHGEDFFRATETRVLKDLINSQDNLIISTGGGTPCYNDNIDLMNANGTTIYIKMSPQSLFNRLINSRAKRPLVAKISKDDLLEYIKNKLQEREKYYLKAHFIVKGENLNAKNLARIIKN
jgi:shikimate kinase